MVGGLPLRMASILCLDFLPLNVIARNWRALARPLESFMLIPWFGACVGWLFLSAHSFNGSTCCQRGWRTTALFEVLILVLIIYSSLLRMWGAQERLFNCILCIVGSLGEDPYLWSTPGKRLFFGNGGCLWNAMEESQNHILTHYMIWLLVVENFAHLSSFMSFPLVNQKIVGVAWMLCG